MAGDWIKMRNDLTEDPAVIRIAARVGLDEFAVVGRLHALWAWADEQSLDGHAPGVTAAWLDRKVQRDGFAQALVDVGWLDVAADGLRIPNFEHHNGATAKARALGTRRKQRQRAHDDPPPVPPVVPAKTTPASRSGHGAGVTKARPEKRREEKKNPPTPRKAGGCVRFDDFWLAWPKSERKQDKAKCLDYWKRNGLDTIAEQILADVRTKRGTRKWREGHDEAPLTYLRGQRWNDGTEPTEPGEGSQPWDANGATIRAKGVALGLGEWDQDAFEHARPGSETFLAYTARVREAIERFAAVAA